MKLETYNIVAKSLGQNLFMSQPVICHFLIGIPASGKSTFARKLQKMIPNSAIISTDTTRKKLFGDESIQGNWSDEVEPEILKQVKDAIASNKAVIYDATNVRRDWRMGMLMKIEEKLKEMSQVYWVAWHLQTPIDICKEWNQKRDRKVPDEVIESFDQSLKQFRPHKGEGFIQISEVAINNVKLDYDIKIRNKKKVDLIQAANPSLDFSKVLNRKNKYTWHQYSQLLDFERLMHLISLVVRYPGIGNLSTTQPKVFQNALQVEKTPNFLTCIDEIIAVIEKEYSSLYTNKDDIKKDLFWLKNNGLIGYTSANTEIHIKRLNEAEISQKHHLYTHRYSNFDEFSRLIKIIRFICYYPYLRLDGKTAIKTTITIGDWTEENIRRTALVEELINQQILSENNIDIEARRRLENLVREDIRQLKPYKIIHDPFNTTVYSKVTKKFAMNKGYFIGTGIFSKNELNEIFNLLRSQAEENYFNDPLAQQTYQDFKERMENSKLWQDAPPYPVKVIGSKSAVDFNRDRVNRDRFESFEKAIRNRNLIRLEIVRQLWESQEQTRYIQVYPLQIVFHHFAWYLGYEIAEGEKAGLLYFERIDRLRVNRVEGNRSKSKQIESLKNLDTLYQSSAGIYLGGDVKDQKQYLNHKTRKSVEKTLEIFATKNSFRFLSETTQRFPEHKMQMTLPEWLEGHPYNKNVYSLKISNHNTPHIYRIKITLPKWFVDDIYLIQWLVPWGDEIKVMQPKELIDKIQLRGSGIVNLYKMNS